MKAIVVKGPKDYVVEDVPYPDLPDGFLMLKPLYCGICFTEVHRYLGIYGGLGAGNTTRTLADILTGRQGSPMTSPPHSNKKTEILGHEASGEVVAIGKGVEGWKIGDRVSVDPATRCGKCLACQAGLQCTGSYRTPAMDAEYSAVPADSCFKLPDTVSDLAGASVESFVGSTQAMRHSGIVVGDNVVIFGAEDHAVGALQWLKLGGAGKVAVVDPIKVRRDVVEKLGADLVIDPTNTDPAPAIREIMPFGADCVLVALETYIKPSMKYIEQAFDVSRWQGKVVVMRQYASQPFHDINYNVPWIKRLSVFWSGGRGYESWRGGRDRSSVQVTIDAIASKKLDAESYVTKIIPFDQINTKKDVDAAFAQLPDKASKVVFKIWGK